MVSEGNNEQSKHNAIRIILILAISVSLMLFALFPVSCSNTDWVNEKVSAQLLTQINLRKEQIAEPIPDRLEVMQNSGMRVDNLEIQRIFIHLSQELNTSQIEELESMGIILYQDSWIPPVGTHPTGFLTADMPIDKLEELAGKDYVVRLETAEQVDKPHGGDQPQVE